MGYSHFFPLSSPAIQGMETPGKAKRCDWCLPRLWEKPLGRITLPDTVSNSDGTDKFFPFVDDNGANLTGLGMGKYVVRYCRGAWVDAVASGSVAAIWAVTKEAVGQAPYYHSGHRIWGSYYDNTGAIQMAFFNEVGDLYSSYNDAETALNTPAGSSSWGCFTSFDHYGGGNVTLGFVDAPVNDNANAVAPQSNPVFLLSRAIWPLVLDLGHSNVQRNFAGPQQWIASITILNQTPLQFNGITGSLRTTGGLSNLAEGTHVTFAPANSLWTDQWYFDGPSHGALILDVSVLGNSMGSVTLNY